MSSQTQTKTMKDYNSSTEGKLNITRLILLISSFAIGMCTTVYDSSNINHNIRFYVGLGILVIGGLLFFICNLALIKLATQVNNTGRRAFRSDGVYKYSRHPFYVSQTIVFIGFIVIAYSMYSLIGLILSFIVTYITMRQEEKEMLLTFGATYQTYREKTPIIPWKIWRLM